MGRHPPTGRAVFQLEGSGRAGFVGVEHPAELLVRLDLAEDDEPIEGSIVLQRADRPFAPMGVPYVADDLPRITYRVDGSR